MIFYSEMYVLSIDHFVFSYLLNSGNHIDNYVAMNRIRRPGEMFILRVQTDTAPRRKGASASVSTTIGTDDGPAYEVVWIAIRE